MVNLTCSRIFHIILHMYIICSTHTHYVHWHGVYFFNQHTFLTHVLTHGVWQHMPIITTFGSEDHCVVSG